MMQTRSYFTLPPVVPTLIDDRISVIVPVARTNLCINPSFETNTTSWTAIGGSIARSTLFQYHGAYSLAITPTAATTDGARYDTVSLVSGTTYAYSCKVLGVAGKSYKLAIETTGGVELSSRTFVATGRWQWLWGYYGETSTTTRRLTVRKAGGTETSIFYIDGAQVEALAALESVSTYLDGDQLGMVPNQQPPAYVWNGTPHASTSTRSALTRAGGMVIPFKSFGFFLTALIGLGLAPPANIATEYARIDGGYDDYTRKPSRQFTVQGNFESRGDYLSLRQQRGGLSRLLDRDLVAQDQRLVLLREVVDECDQLASTTCRLIGKYQGGLEGQTDNHLASVAPITFTQYLGVVLSDGESGGALSVQTALSVAQITKRAANGVWSILGTGLNSSAQDILVASSGLVYVTGQFSTAGGGAAAAIAVWNPTTGAWSALGAGLTGGGATGYALAEAPNGDIYVGGDFTNAGASGADYIARWDGSTWNVVGSATAINNIVRGMAIGPTGIVYAGGDFTNAGGDASADRIAQWNGVAWSALGTGMDNIVRSIVVLADGTIYAGGDFATADGNAAVRIAKWNGSAWSAMGAGLTGGGTNRAFKLALAKNNVLFVGGTFTAAGGIGANNIAQWNGVTFSPLGSGVNSDVRNFVITPDGQLIVRGQFTSAGGVTITGAAARWNGAAWVPIDSDLAGGPVAAGLALSPGGDLYSSTNTASMVSAGITTINNPGTANSYPVIVINGPTVAAARVFGIWNYTTNRAIYLNYTPNVGENATLTLQPDNLSFVSDFRGDIMSLVMPGSNIADFFLQPGPNSIGLFALGSTTVAVIQHRPAYLSLDDVP